MVDVDGVHENGGQGAHGGLHEAGVAVIQARDERRDGVRLVEAKCEFGGAQATVQDAGGDFGRERLGEAREAREHGLRLGLIRRQRQGWGLGGEILQRLGRRLLHFVQGGRLQELREQGRQVVVLRHRHELRIIELEREPQQHAHQPLLERRDVAAPADLHHALLHLVDAVHDHGQRVVVQQRAREVGVLDWQVGQQTRREGLLLRHAGGSDELDECAQLARRDAQSVGELLAHVEGEHVEEADGHHAEVGLGGFQELDEAHHGARAFDGGHHFVHGAGLGG